MTSDADSTGNGSGQGENLPGDDADYEGLDELESIGLGILQELSLIRQELQAIRAGVATIDAGDSSGVDMFECQQCGRGFEDRQSARGHAVHDHGAPREDDYWFRLFNDGGES